MNKINYFNTRTGFHILRKNDNLNMQNDFIFVDTETKRIKYKNNIEEKFYLGWLIYWNRKENTKDYLFLKNKKQFYDYILNVMKNTKHLFIFAHNMDFDIKVLGGINRLINKGYYVDSFYIEGTRFIIKLKNRIKTIEILDTMNYIPMSLKMIGKSIGLEKKDINFNICSDKELSDYCKNDTEIICLFIQKLIDFLEKYNLSKLKNTVSSLSLNIFRHHFYNEKNNPIYIHNWHSAIDLEKMSYRGGITDCFRVGENIKDKLYKLDVNSMYPYVMKNYKMPTKLIYYRDISTCKSNILNDVFNKYINSDKLIIARCKIFLPVNYAYILTRAEINKQSKSLFLAGKYNITLTTPELKFILKYGKILDIYNLAVYESKIIFNDFVDFFYHKRNEFKQNKNYAYALFCKYILNSLYGKFGQSDIIYTEYENKGKSNFSSKNFIDTIENRTYVEMTMGNKIFQVEKKDNCKSFDSFIAISSFVTAYARMYLVEMILKAERKNVYYVDTDCLFVNDNGLFNLAEFFNNKDLGKLKLEAISYNTTIYKPKYYIFNDKEKCKGVKKNHKVLSENKDKLIIEQEQFTRFKTSLRKNEFNKQMINYMIKEIDKHYDKGIIKENGIIEPYKIGVR